MGNLIGFILSALVHLSIILFILNNIDFTQRLDKEVPVKLNMFVVPIPEPLPTMETYNNDKVNVKNF